jgi:3',5'-nucleoside bisphosphate phosphatase
VTALIDLHTHTTESDGSLAPEELVRAAVDCGLEALAITDHDTFGGYDQAAPHALAMGLELVSAVELSVSHGGESAHLLAYFVNAAPGREFREWVSQMQQTRRRRNQQLVEKLQARGLDITLDEVTARGRKQSGRPHFAAIMLEKGYVNSLQHAFDDYLAETGCCFVSREEPPAGEAIERILQAGGVPVLPHPHRISDDLELLELNVAQMAELGLRGIEVFHSSHSPVQASFCQELAHRFALVITGGSDFHGDAKPGIHLGTGVNGNLAIPRRILDELRRVAGS